MFQQNVFLNIFPQTNILYDLAEVISCKTKHKTFCVFSRNLRALPCDSKRHVLNMSDCLASITAREGDCEFWRLQPSERRGHRAPGCLSSVYEWLMAVNQRMNVACSRLGVCIAATDRKNERKNPYAAYTPTDPRRRYLIKSRRAPRAWRCNDYGMAGNHSASESRGRTLLQVGLM